MNGVDPLKKNLEWYIQHQAELVAKHSGKILLIVDQKLIGAFDTMEAAYTEAVKTHEPGTFTLQPCAEGEGSYTLTLYNPRYCIPA